MTPQVVVDINQINSSDGNMIKMTCTVLRGNPMIYTFSWTFDNGTDSVYLDCTLSVLIFTKFTSKQFGTYSCIVSNGAGTGIGNATIINSDEECKIKNI